MDEGLRTICKALFTCNWLYHQVYLGLIEGESRHPMKSYALAQMEMLAKGRAAASDIAVAHTRQAFAELARVAAIQGFTVLIIGVPSQAQVLQRLREVEEFEIDSRADDYGETLFETEALTSTGRISWRHHWRASWISLRVAAASFPHTCGSEAFLSN
jgi:hypothetical protein